MKFAETNNIVKMLANEWNLGKRQSGAKTNICAWIYWIDILKCSEKIIIEKENNKVIGVCGYANYKNKRFSIKKHIYKFILFLLKNSKDIKNKEQFDKYNQNYDYLPKELEDNFDGEISILIVDKNYRGKNIGKKLLLSIFEAAKIKGLKNLYISSDESCSYNFYDACGCKKVYETTVENLEYDKLGNKKNEKAFIYEKKLS